MVDLTTLEGQDTPGKVRALCAKAAQPDPSDPSCPPVAAVCVYGDLVDVAVEALAGSGVHIAAVATAFPSGRAPLDVKLADARAAVEAGRRRDRHGHRPGRLPRRRATSTCTTRSWPPRQACGDAHLKVILETGELATYDNVRRASWLAMLGRRRLHQDLHRQGLARRHAAGHPGACSRRCATSAARPGGRWA